MRDIYPDFYHTFKCIANRCEDSCCKDWDIDIDSETERFYQTVSGELGDKLRRKLVTDEYDERVFKAEGGRCPFWNRDMLCDIFIGIGARLMLRAENPYAAFGGEEELDAAFGDDGFTSFLLKARERSAQLLCDNELPFAYRLADCLEFNAQVQSILQGEEPQPLSPASDPPEDCRFIFDLHLGFEIMSDRWRTALRDVANNPDALTPSEDFARDFEKFALYYLYRYYLEAVRSGDVLYSLKRIVCAYLVTGRLDADFASKGYPLPRLRILQRYSKEVEHSYDNTEALNAAFDADPRFSAENLIALLEQSV